MATGFEYWCSWRVRTQGDSTTAGPVSLARYSAGGSYITPYDPGACLGNASWAWFDGIFVTYYYDTGRNLTSGLRPVFKLKPGLKVRLENGIYELD